jgi:8-amino-7-oxononanoate synthase
VTWRDWADGRCRAIDTARRKRAVRDFDARGPRGTIDGRPVVSFASNDYLGLAGHPAVVDAARNALERWGAGATAARLVVGSRPVHSALEAALADWKHTERALLFPSGYAANLGVLAAIADAGTVICSDELNHASIIDGCRLARADVAIYPHGDAHELERVLRRTARAVVVTESVFSMDGDLAPVAEIAGLCARYDALLVVDEAHGVLGPPLELGGAAGRARPDRKTPEVLRVGTLSKFLGAVGGYVAGPAPMIELLTNVARPFIFTTASTPADAAAGLCALTILRSAEGRVLRDRLAGLVERVAPGHPSPIVPLVLGAEDEALAASQRLLDRGLLVPAIRPPTVPTGSSRLRVTLSASHTDAEVQRLTSALTELSVARV